MASKRRIQFKIENGPSFFYCCEPQKTLQDLLRDLEHYCSKFYSQKYSMRYLYEPTRCADLRDLSVRTGDALKEDEVWKIVLAENDVKVVETNSPAVSLPIVSKKRKLDNLQSENGGSKKAKYDSKKANSKKEESKELGKNETASSTEIEPLRNTSIRKTETLSLKYRSGDGNTKERIKERVEEVQVDSETVDKIKRGYDKASKEIDKELEDDEEEEEIDEDEDDDDDDEDVDDDISTDRSIDYGKKEEVVEKTKMLELIGEYGRILEGSEFASEDIGSPLEKIKENNKPKPKDDKKNIAKYNKKPVYNKTAKSNVKQNVTTNTSNNKPKISKQESIPRKKQIVTKPLPKHISKGAKGSSSQTHESETDESIEEFE